MKKALRHHFIPHEGNNFHPHILHTRSLAWYGGLMLTIKGIVVAFVLALPFQAFLLTDVLDAQEKKVVEITNDLREKIGQPNLRAEDKLRISARNKAHDMASHDYFSHTNPTGKTVGGWIDDVGYTYRVAGENLAMGFPSADEVVQAWVQSPTHYANLVDPDFSVIGVAFERGMSNGKDTVYITQHFADPVLTERQPLGRNTQSPKRELNSKKPPTRQKAVLGEKTLPVIPFEENVSPWKKYSRAKELLSPIFVIFSFEKAFYIWLIVLFSILLFLTILIEIKKQHPRVILFTLALIGLGSTLLIL